MATAIPVINSELETDVSTEAPAKASFWQRAKSRVVDIAKRIASPIAAASRTTAKAVKVAATKVASATKRTTLKVGRSVKRAAKAVASKFRRSGVPSEGRLWRARRAADKTATRVVAWLRETWHRVLRPFIRLRVVAYGIVFAVVGLVVAPVTTLLVAAGIGAALVGLSYVVEWLEGSSSRAARVALKAIEIVGQLVVGLVYAATIALTLVLCTYLPFLLTEVLELVLRYLNVRNAVLISSLVYFALAGEVAYFVVFGTLALLRWAPARRSRSIDEQTVESSGNRKTRVVATESEWATATKFEAALAKSRERVAARHVAGAAATVDAVVSLEPLPSSAGMLVDEITLVRKGDFDGAAQLIASRSSAGLGYTLEEARAWVARVAKEENISPRRVKLPKCSACGVDDGGMRFGLRGHHDLCGSCFNQLDTEEALEAARTGRLNKAGLARLRKMGVKIPKAVEAAVNAQLVNRRRELTLDEIGKLSAVANSRDDVSRIHWAETAWWYDRDGKPRVREWLGFVDGRSVVAVEYRHEKESRGFDAWLLGAQKDDDRKVGTFHTLGGAQDSLGDALTNQAATVGGMLDALATEAPAPAEKTEVLTFEEAHVFDSPEAHIAFVRKTEGDAAADALEETYLQTMIAAEKSS